MNVQQRNITDGHTVAELCALLIDLHYNQHTIRSSHDARAAGITDLDVAQQLFHRIVGKVDDRDVRPTLGEPS